MGLPVAVSTDGNVSCGVVLWRFQRQLALTVVVKATFTIVPDAPATLAGPGEILREDRTFDRRPTRSVERAADVAPYLARCDVLFTGHAHAPGGRPATASSVRLGIARDARPLLDKTLHVYGDRRAGSSAPEPFTRMPLVYERALGGPGEPNPVGVETPNVVAAIDPHKPGGFGPISCFWPQRKRLLGKIDRRTLEGPIAELPDAMAWDYFQAAPPDQQIAYLSGGEWIVLDGLHPTLPRVRTQIAPARGAARVIAARPLAPPVETPVELACDTLAIDGDQQVFSLVWRGRFQVPGDEAALPSLRVLAALETPGTAIDWARLAEVSSAQSPNPAPPADSEGEGTMALDLDRQDDKPLAPFALAGAAPRAAPTRVEATPWAQAPLRSPPRGAPGEATIATSTASGRASNAGEGTIALRPQDQSDAAERPLAPFAIAAAMDRARDAAPRPSASLPGAPWSEPSAEAAAPPPRPLAGEATLALPDASFTPPAPVEPPALLAPLAPPAPIAAATASPAAAPAVAPPIPQLQADPAPLPPIAAPAAPAPRPKPPPARDPDTLANRLRAVGAGDDDIAALLRALHPPPPPPPDDDG